MALPHKKFSNEAGILVAPRFIAAVKIQKVPILNLNPRAMNRADAFSQKISCGIAIYRDDQTNKYYK